MCIRNSDSVSLTRPLSLFLLFLSLSFHTILSYIHNEIATYVRGARLLTHPLCQWYNKYRMFLCRQPTEIWAMLFIFAV